MKACSKTLLNLIQYFTVEICLKTEGKKALLVGINKYSDRKVTNLNFCVNDVTSTYEILVDPERGGFDPNYCHLMTDNSEDRLKPIRSNLMSSIKSLSKTAKSNDYLLFFFSGHGIEENEKSYLLPADARINVLGDTAISIDWIKETMKKSKARAKVLILDSCHSGAIKGKAESGRMTKGLHDSIFPAPRGFAILTSCTMNEVSYEMPDKKSSVFTYFLNEGITGAADFDNDGKIAIPDASRYATDKTLEWASNEGVEQSPTLKYNVVRDLILVHVPTRKTDLEEARVTLPEAFDVTQFISSIRFFFGNPVRTEDEARNWGERVCAFLLRYYDFSQIKTDGDICRFPHGFLNKKRGFIDFSYSKGHVEIVERIICSYLTLREKARGFSIILPKNILFDSRKVAQLEDESKLVDIRYNPKFTFLRAILGEKYSKVFTKNPIRIRISSPPSRKESDMYVYQYRKMLDARTYMKITPSKLFEFFGNILKPVKKT